MSGYVPKILLCGDRAEFFAEIKNRPVKIAGQVDFFGEAEGQNFNFFQDGKFSLDGRLHNYNKIAELLRGGHRFYSSAKL